MPAKPKKPAAKRTIASRVLTVKNLPAASFYVIHSLPYGYRQSAMQGLLAAAAVFARKNSEWYLKLAAGRVKLAHGKAN